MIVYVYIQTEYIWIAFLSMLEDDDANFDAFQLMSNLHVSIHTCIYMYTHICIYVYMYICIYTQRTMYMRMLTRVYKQYIYEIRLSLDAGRR